MPNRPHPLSPHEAREVFEVALKGAARAGAPPHLRADLAQTVAERFITKWNRPHLVAARARGERAWHNYIMMAATNAYADHRLKERRRTAREERAETRASTRPPTDRPNSQRPASTAPSAIDEYLGRRLVVDLINECLGGMTATVAHLHLVDGRNTREISDELGLSVRAVNRHKQEAVAKLRSHLGQPP